jgi:hypothetical protein
MAGAVLADALSHRRRSAPFQQEHQTKIKPGLAGLLLLVLVLSTLAGDGGRHGSYIDTTIERTYLDGLSSGCQKIDGGRRKEKPPPK